MSTTSSSSENSSLARGVQIVDLIAQTSPIGFNEIRRRLDDVSPSMLSKVLRYLLEQDLVRKDEKSKYVLGQRLWKWQSTGKKPFNLVSLCEGELRQINQTHQVTTALYVPGEDRLTCKCRFLDQYSPSLVPPGNSIPKTLLGLGVVFLYTKKQSINKRTLKNHLKILPHNHVEDPKDLEPMLLEAHDTQIMDDPGLCFRGVWRLATPIHHDKKIIGILSIGALLERAKDRDCRSNLRNALREAKENINSQLANY